jgi:hypothetical protein
MKLDNRTKKVAVSGVEIGGKTDEYLREYLMVSIALPIDESFPSLAVKVR